MSHIRDVQDWLSATAFAGVVIPSTDEFISEWAPPATRRLRWTTGFRGSVGVAVILRETAALFVDGRYRLQGAVDTEGASISIEAATSAARRAWLQSSLRRGAKLALDPWVHSILDMRQWQALGDELGLAIEMTQSNPIDALWSQGRPAPHAPAIVDYPTEYAGEPHSTKCAQLVDYVRSAGLAALMVADPEDVSWLLNVRTDEEVVRTVVGDLQIVPSCASRALVWRDGRVQWFVDAERVTAAVTARVADDVTIERPHSLVAELSGAARQGRVGLDPRRSSAALATIIEAEGTLCVNDTVARRRWCKHAVELRSARQAHIIDAAAVVRFMAWLEHALPERTISEFEAAETLESFRASHPAYKGASMPLMSASGPSGAQPHYVPRRERCRQLNDHPIFWMDSGGQYFGGSTDNTITLAVGMPEPKHVLAHTLVLQGYIALASARVPEGTHALRLDTIAREPLWREGMDFSHNTGHGVGNYLNIHEGPLIGRDPGPTTCVPLECGMIVTNEPGYYAAGDFGLRIESHMAVVASRYPGFIEFETISRLPIDPALIDFARLSPSERCWLAEYHDTVLRDLEALLDAQSAGWLRALVKCYASSAEPAAGVV